MIAKEMQPTVILLKKGLPLTKGHGVAPLMEPMPSARSIPIVLYGKQRQMHDTDGGRARWVSRSPTSCNGAELLDVATKRNIDMQTSTPEQQGRP